MKPFFKATLCGVWWWSTQIPSISKANKSTNTLDLTPGPQDAIARHRQDYAIFGVRGFHPKPSLSTTIEWGVDPTNTHWKSGDSRPLWFLLYTSVPCEQDPQHWQMNHRLWIVHTSPFPPLHPNLLGPAAVPQVLLPLVSENPTKMTT